MRSTKGDRSSSAQETRERILQAAFRVFAEHGFDASLRAIAKAAGVSPPLILHYYGSRDGLRAACDEQFRSRTFEFKYPFLDPIRGSKEIHRLKETVREYAPLVGYLLRVLRSGGPESRSFIDAMVAETEKYLEHGVEAGVVRPSIDPAGRARVLVEMSFGLILFDLDGDGGRLDLEELPERIAQYSQRISVPLFEIATHGYIANSDILETAMTVRDQVPSEQVPTTKEKP